MTISRPQSSPSSFPRRDAVTVVAMVHGKEYSQILPPAAPKARSEFPVGARFLRRNG